MLFKKSEKKKALEGASELLRLGRKVRAYRSDVMEAGDLAELDGAMAELESAYKRVKGGGEFKDFKKERGRLDRIMKKSGGTLYPVKFLPDNAEVLLVAAMLAIGIRAFFLMPFVIPTNSMYPTYNGMTSEVRQLEEEGPGLVKRMIRLATLGAVQRDVRAPRKGEVLIPLATRGSFPGVVDSRAVKGRKWFGLLSEMKREYTFYVGGEAVKFRVPAEFSDMDEVVRKTYFGGSEGEDMRSVVEMAREEDGIVQNRMGPMLKTGRYLRSGDKVMDFDILKGDMLFADRMSYNFRRPKVGEAIVFRTANIRGMRDAAGNPEEKYFIKRLVGEGGDKLEVRPPVLYRNGEPITGAKAFGYNAEKVGEYPGYTAVQRLRGGKTEVIPEGYFFAMGDNSPHSADSRYWGYVPEKEVVGKAVFIFYPFSNRWGLAK